ncbi:hypothetical protein [Sphingomonas aerolata]|uniref:hypothetical protein n=1 Tax=Sphingomonas aerolata TaxID=185951 RepID=UPI00208E54F5|nr:hypothetical protein [Sphingomonas aerolata]USR01916.1 hypothetical protein NEF64_08975 [Sphingomonas aerolata]
MTVLYGADAGAFSIRARPTARLKTASLVSVGVLALCTDPTRPDFETRILGQLGDPKDEFTFNADLTLGQFTVGYGAHYIGPMFTTAYANLYPINGNPAQNVDVNDIRRYPDVVYHNVRASVQLGSDTTNRKGMEWFVGIDNLGNRKPPLGTTATGAGSAIYEVIGRSFFTGVRATF